MRVLGVVRVHVVGVMGGACSACGRGLHVGVCGRRGGCRVACVIMRGRRENNFLFLKSYSCAIIVICITGLNKKLIILIYVCVREFVTI